MADTKKEIIGLLARREWSAQGLGGELDMTPAGVRQHLASLEAQGLITHRKLGGEPNRPTFLYRLSEAGKADLPKHYDLFASALLRRLKAHAGQAGAAQLMEQTGVDVAEAQAADLPAGDARARAQAALALLNGSLECPADLDATPGAPLRFTLYSCPFQSVSEQHADLCPAFFGGWFRRMLGAGQVTCARVLQGVACCEVVVQVPA